VVDPDQVEAGVLDLHHDPDLVARVDPVVVGAGLVRLGRKAPVHPVALSGQDAAGLVGEPGLGVGDDLVAQRGRDHHQTRSSISC